VALTTQQKNDLNKMCPAAAAATLGDKIDNAITGVVDAGSISTAELANSAVTSTKIATGAVEAAKITTGAVTSTKIATGAVETAKITADAVTTAKIADGNITTAKLTNSAVTFAKTAIKAISGTVTTANTAVGVAHGLGSTPTAVFQGTGDAYVTAWGATSVTVSANTANTVFTVYALS